MELFSIRIQRTFQLVSTGKANQSAFHCFGRGFEGQWLLAQRFWKEVSEAIPARRVGQPVQCTVHGIAFRSERMQYEPVHLVQ